VSRAAVQEKLEEDVLDFARGRLETMARDEEHKPDLVGAVLKAGCDDVPDFWARLEALERLSGSPRFRDLVQLVERLRNITKGEPSNEPSSAALKEPAEKELFRAWEQARGEVEGLVSRRDYARAGELYEKTFTGPVERFMKEVFVNEKDETIAKNRKALLKSVHRLLAEKFADLAEVVVVRG
jgi:glycyl-tRNA synthetase beta chain